MSARPVDALVIGGGHAGLAMSYCLAQRGIDHLVLERGEVANAWRRERWDSLRLLTPNWQARLPGYHYAGDNPDGFMTAAEVADFIHGYAAHIGTPVRTGVAVTAVTGADNHFKVATSGGHWRCRSLIMATGAFAVPTMPATHRDVPPQVTQLHAGHYRNPHQLPPGAVLVVGASASGLQLAEEIQRSGRPVILAAGEHVRLPRQYRGRDIQWWLDALGVAAERWDQVDDLQRARRVPSPQLVGSPDRQSLDLNRLQALGVRLTGRLMAVNGDNALFSGSLANVCALADLKQQRLLERIDQWATAQGLALPPAERIAPTQIPERPPLALDFSKEGIRTVLWATGFRPDYSWLKLPVFDGRGQLRHDGGVVAPGLYAMGLPFMRRRQSSLIHGANSDAWELSAHLAAHLSGRETIPGALRRAALAL